MDEVIPHDESCCPLCKSSDAVRMGPIFHDAPLRIAGVEVAASAGGPSVMMRCSSCGLRWKTPRIPDVEIARCYCASASDNWGAEIDGGERRVQDLIAILKAQVGGGRVLDFGCSNGAILGFFGEEWERFGIEPSISAAERARCRGITILDGDWRNDGTEVLVDAILMIDVIEHLASPVEVMRRLRRLLRPNGVIVVFTGDTSSWAWKMFGSRHWYASLPEHIAFYSPSCMHMLAERSGLAYVAAHQMSHLSLPWRRRFEQLIRAWAWVFLIAICIVIPGGKRWRWYRRRSPYWPAAKDHFASVLRAV